MSRRGSNPSRAERTQRRAELRALQYEPKQPAPHLNRAQRRARKRAGRTARTKGAGT